MDMNLLSGRFRGTLSRSARYGALGVSLLGLAFAGGTEAAVLYSQLGSPVGNGQNSQNYAPINAANNMAADDFIVTGTGWHITDVFFDGELLNGPGPGPGGIIAANGGTFDITFYTDASGLPGVVSVTIPSVAFTEDGLGNVTANLGAGVDLLPGTYWVSGVANMDFATNGQWFWDGSSVQSGNVGVWQNPGNGLNTGCTTWAAVTSCGATFPDFLFEVRGSQLSVAPVPEPASFTLLGIGLAGLSAARRRKTAA